MAKSLGQIHSVNFGGNVTTTGQTIDLNCPGELTQQLNRIVRAGNFFKCVGIDINAESGFTGPSHATISGRLLYYAPTRGRCAAFRGAFKAMANSMKLQGLTMRDNPMYDFTVPLNQDSLSHANQATLDGTIGLALNHTTPTASIFAVHNANVQPQYTGTAGDLFTSGFSSVQNPTNTSIDFVVNDSVPYTGNANVASEEYESIPFTISWDGVGTETAMNFQWRPDPALYVAIMCGQLQMVIDEKTTNDLVRLNVNIMISGWKSIMGSPDKKARRKAAIKDIRARRKAMTRK